MAEHWITAKTALSLVAEGTQSAYLARLTICSRAYHGLLKARAALVVVGSDQFQHEAVPAELWWAEGKDALDQNWEVGDFATWIGNRLQMRASELGPCNGGT
jgi:hypothetical protein